MSSAEQEYQRLSTLCRRLNALFKRKFMFRGAIICGVCFTLAIAIVLMAFEQLWVVCSIVSFLGVVYLIVDRRVQAINSEINEMMAVIAHLETVKSAYVCQRHTESVYRKED